MMPKGAIEPTSLFIYASNVTKAKFTGTRNINGVPLSIDIDELVVRQSQGNFKYYKYANENKEAYKKHLIPQLCKEVILKGFSNLRSHYQNTRGGLFSLNKNKNAIDQITTKSDQIIMNATTSEATKLKALINLTLSYIAPNNANLESKVAELNNEKKDHHFRRYLGLVLQEATKNLDVSKLKLDDDVKRKLEIISKIEIPSSSQYSTFKASSEDKEQSKGYRRAY